jgi:uncharacterized cupredoxin-like copper-binding protein
MSRLTVIGLLTIFVAACHHPAPDPPDLVIVASDYSFSLPDSIPGGVVHVRLINAGHDLHEAMLTRFTNAGGNAAAFADSEHAGVDFPSNTVDVGGAALTASGDSSDVWLALPAGHYVVACYKGDHLSRGMLRDLVVTARQGPGRPPRATHELELSDYGYSLSMPFVAGRQTLHVHNAGREAHEADMIRLTERAGLKEYLDWLDHHQVGLPPAQPVAGIGDIAAGLDAWLELRLTPGRYALVCQVLAPGGQAHYRLGMIKEFVVQ